MDVAIKLPPSSLLLTLLALVSSHDLGSPAGPRSTIPTLWIGQQGQRSSQGAEAEQQAKIRKYELVLVSSLNVSISPYRKSLTDLCMSLMSI